MIIKYKNKTIQKKKIYTPQETSKKPTIYYKADPNKLYTFIVDDHDSTAGNRLHWLIINIPGTKMDQGIQLLPYKGPDPPPNSGIHQYFFKVYEQEGKIDLSPHFVIPRIIPLQEVMKKLNTGLKLLEITYFLSKYTGKLSKNTKKGNITQKRQRRQRRASNTRKNRS
jgi:phosphatidylethanolamine-binding protein (PEBP) family uncharacterized protein